MKNDLIKLVYDQVTQDQDGFEVNTPTEYECWAEMQSVKRTEFYAAAAAGMKVCLVVVINYMDYYRQDKKASKVIIEGTTYTIIRVYRKAKMDDVELTLAEVE